MKDPIYRNTRDVPASYGTELKEIIRTPVKPKGKVEYPKKKKKGVSY